MSCLRQGSARGQVGEGAVKRKGSISVKFPVAYSASVFCGNGRTVEMRARVFAVVLQMLYRFGRRKGVILRYEHSKMIFLLKVSTTTNMEPTRQQKGPKSEPK